MISALNLIDIAGIALTLWLLKQLTDRRDLGTLPPGPKALPLIGNVADFPSYKPWETFFEWGQRYGPLVYITMMGQPMVVINSHKIASNLLDKRSAIYSDRQQPPSAKMIGYTNTGPLVAYGEHLREQRRLLNRTLGTRALVEKYGPLEELEARILIQRILRDPSSEHLFDHVKTYASAILLLLTYGYQMKRDGKDDMLDKAFELLESFNEATLPGAFLVDVIPALRYVPSWFPGTGWQRRIQGFKHIFYSTVQGAFQYTKDQMARGTAIPSFISRNLEDPSSSPEKEAEVMWAGISMLGGGTDTTMGTIYALFLAMTLYPEVQRKAHAEIDAVVGHDRLPTFQDRDSLPYIAAICTELLRWMPVAPLGIPHCLTQDDAYDNYSFRKGTVFIVNSWGILHDPKTYPDPSEFSPERYLADHGKVPQPDPRGVTFGYGRRSCPGIHIADASIYIVVANILSAFIIEKKLKNGTPLTPTPTLANGIISHPEHFECNIKPRNADVERLIHSANEDREHAATLV